MWTDGGARGNPGPAGIGVRLMAVETADNEAQTIAELSESIGHTTNNQAEYRALLAGLEWLTRFAIQQQVDLSEIRLDVYTDSELMAYQIQGRYKVKNLDLKPVYDQCTHILSKLKEYTITPIPRAKNQVADKLVNEAIDAATGAGKGR